ncbi:hypothetical protein N5079_20950 [Planotetraspora sp. A-T 1434]|uniref:hypothetical protein n=1 Tax=Planotetraspora sp. A-T 1434 TaxID=2979219 RepID=UPI0021C0F095|nr:hypothetical protein [Planotetraspora sp. A-T 1434]MCT9932674.1 hypothetical protein [Planotetraspora sp. A-T 1434]
MSVLRAITKPLRDVLGHRDDLREKAKDLPVYVLQTALSSVGHALLIGDRVRTTIKRLTGSEEETAYAPSPAATQPTEEEEARPARREPVIFAPRPEKEAAAPAAAKPEPVIFAPGRKPEAAPPEAAPPAAELFEEAAAGAVPGEAEKLDLPAVPVEAEPPEVAAALDRQTETRPAPKPRQPRAKAPRAEEAAKAPEKAPEKAPAKPRARKAAEKPAAPPAPETASEKAPAKPAAMAPEAAKAPAKPAAKAPAKAPAKPAPRPAAEAAGEGLAEPLPGYSGLTLASLRARLRGKTVEQVRELLDYERGHAGRAEVIRLFQNRIGKLEAGVPPTDIPGGPLGR